MGRLESKRALITGAASGIGRASAERFAREGAQVALADIDAERGEQTAALIRERGGRALFIPCDVTKAEDCQRAVNDTVEAFGGLDVLFNNAGIIRRADVPGTTEADWDRTMEVNVKSVFLMCKYAIPVMADAGGGAVLITGSGASLVGIRKGAAYAASKAAVLNLARAMAVDHGHQNIRFNCLCPGDADTPMLKNEAKQLGISDDEFQASSIARRPLARLGTPEELAAAAVYLASDDSAFMTGAFLLLDGGAVAS